MSQDVNQDWSQREFVESVEVSLRKCVAFLNHFQESTSYRLSLVDQRLTSLERQLDFLEAQMKHSDPKERGGKAVPFKKSVFDPETRRDLKTKAYELRRKGRGFTGRVIAPKKTVGTGMIISGVASAGSPRTKRAAGPKATVDDEKKDDSVAPTKAKTAAKTTKAAAATTPTTTATKTPTGEGATAATATPTAAAATKTPAASTETPGEKPAAPPFPHGKRDDIDFRVISAGSGPRPAPTSKVEIAYSVFLSDGKCLIQHRETISLGIGDNIQGLERGCCKMNTAMKAKIWVPFELGYGPDGIEGFIPPSADLTIEIELIRIVEM